MRITGAAGKARKRPKLMLQQAAATSAIERKDEGGRMKYEKKSG
jgi:hypothetical protein